LEFADSVLNVWQSILADRCDVVAANRFHDQHPLTTRFEPKREAGSGYGSWRCTPLASHALLV
jgi:hypothetical protein